MTNIDFMVTLAGCGYEARIVWRLRISACSTVTKTITEPKPLAVERY